MNSHPLQRTFSMLAACAVCSLLSAQDDPLVLSASQSTTLRPDHEGDPGWIPNEIDLMVYGPKNANPNFRGLVQFDLKSVPKSPVVTAAVLKLTFYKLSGVRNKSKLDIIRVHRLVRPWEDKWASWNKSLQDDEWINKGGDFDPLPIAASNLAEDMTGDPSDKPVEFDVTALVQGWQTGQFPNYGVVLMDTDNDSTTNARPYSMKAEKDENRPKLSLYWAAQPKHNPNALKPSTLKPIGQPITMKISLIASLKQARVGEKYDDHIKAKGGCAPYSFKVKGAIPEGLTLTPDGNFTGTPTKEGKYPLSIQITDAAKTSGSGTVEMVVIVPDNGAVAKGPDKAPDKNDKPADKKPATKKVDDE